MAAFGSPRNPADDARVRYSQSFSSQIFEPENPRSGRNFIPAGKRRDQSTSEMFGSYADKELHAMPKTFVPKEDPFSARQKKQQFLSSDVLPHSVYPASAHPAPIAPPRIEDAMMCASSDESIDPLMRRQQELSSELFGRETPAVDSADAHDMSKRLTPSDFKWFSHPEANQSPTGDMGAHKGAHRDRAYHEKCSGMFDQQSPQSQHGVFFASRKQEQGDVGDIDRLRKHNAQFSDLFGRATPMEDPGEEQKRRPKHRGDAEGRIGVFQDWTDSKTEIMGGCKGPGFDASPGERKAGELFQSRIFGDQGEPGPPGGYGNSLGFRGSARSDALRNPVTTNNASKLARGSGMTTMDIHQAHLRTSLAPEGFYDDAGGQKRWEVVEMHLSGLPSDADNVGVREMCTGGELQIVKVSVEMDPVRNYCKGRAKVQVRYNPERGDINALVQKLEDSRLRVEM